MNCPKCGFEHDANFCPQCGAAADGSNPGQTVIINNPPPKKKKSIVPKVIGGLILVFFLAGVFGGNSDKPKPVSASASGSTTKSSSTSEVQKFKVGESAEYRDVIVTLNGVSSNSGTQFLSPTTGNVFVLCDFTIENNSDKELAISSIMSFDAYADDYSLNISLGALASKSGETQLDGTVGPGKKMRGVVGYEVPKDWAEIEIGVQIDVWSNAKIIFTAQHQ